MKKNTNLRGLLKFLEVIFLIISFFVEASFIHLFNYFGISSQLKKAACIQRYSSRILSALGIRINSNINQSQLSGLLVCNHISYIDILVIAAEVPSLFITSKEVFESGWIGKICKVAGCIFVERRKTSSIKNEVDEIDQALLSGIPLVLFPEATSTQGTDVLPFKTALFECAVRTKSPVHPLCIRYTPTNDLIAYYGDMNLIPHLFALCQNNSPINAQLIRLERYLPQEHTERKYLAKQSYELIRNAYVSGI